MFFQFLWVVGLEQPLVVWLLEDPGSMLVMRPFHSVEVEGHAKPLEVQVEDDPQTREGQYSLQVGCHKNLVEIRLEVDPGRMNRQKKEGRPFVVAQKEAPSVAVLNPLQELVGPLACHPFVVAPYLPFVEVSFHPFVADQEAEPSL